MKEQMINKMAKEAYENCFNDISDMKGEYNDLLDSKVLEEQVNKQALEAQKHRKHEKELESQINNQANKAYVKVFGKEYVEVSKHYPSIKEEYDELMENKNHLLKEMQSLKNA